MGWWKIIDVKTGKPNWTILGSTKEGLINAIPGKDGPEELYNGDDPAEVMEKAITVISLIYSEEWGRSPAREELEACFNFVVNSKYPKDEEVNNKC